MTIERITQVDKVKAAGVGFVSLVGAGPGDPELLTLKAVKCIEDADLILFDRLVSDEIKALFPVATKKIYVGKARNRHCVPQDQLNQYMVDKARQGVNICRIKGGDPFVFGRGSEELLVLRQQGIDAEVIPGITAASGCTTYAGIPLTHRGLSTGCTFVTGHLQQGQLDLNWMQLAKLEHTLVFYMGLSNLSEISRQLIAHGLDPHTPAALIENGCQPQQREFTASLATLPDVAVQEQLQSPTLIVVGQVVALADSLQPQKHQFQKHQSQKYSEEMPRMAQELRA